MNIQSHFLALFAAGAGLAACSATQPQQGPRAFSEVEAQPLRTQPTESAEQAVLTIARDIRDACGISEPQAFFAFNSAQLTQRDDALLRQLASCFTTGPLKGRSMKLVGHADPRGEDEYNYLLGQRRADRMRDAIVGAGMSGAQVSTTSRGENEAAGHDEVGWSKDRRVDVMLGDAI